MIVYQIRFNLLYISCRSILNKLVMQVMSRSFDFTIEVLCEIKLILRLSVRWLHLRETDDHKAPLSLCLRCPNLNILF